MKLFTEPPSVIKGLISVKPNKNDWIKQLQSTNDHLKSFDLYPSVQSGKQRSCNASANGTWRKRSSNTFKSFSSKNKKYHEVLRDVFFIDDSMLVEFLR